MLGERSIWGILTGEQVGRRWGTNRGGAPRPAFKILSKNPFKLRLVREQSSPWLPAARILNDIRWNVHQISWSGETS